MADVFTPAKRSKIMSKVRNRDTKPELVVRAILNEAGIKIHTHDKSLPGCPDIVLKSRKKVIFVHGCFWHGHKNCKRATLPKSNKPFWREKIRINIERDKKAKRRLNRLGWSYLTVWGCQVKDKEILRSRLIKYIKKPKRRKK